MMGIVVAILGGLLGVAGFFLYESSGEIISQGDMLWGLGWLFQSIDKADAHLYQMGGLAGMVVGFILVLFGLIYQMKRKV
ncbi:unnamed protein product [marine sediment metagenome]|uniref:Uncharacterized protein n=1 Tax=marine sediment metagenome TaxID=412755 RepID=X1LL55_9ZZZZ